jgi:hypothetical protein
LGTSAAYIAAFVVIGGIYLALSYYIYPDPDLSDLGWFGGLMNNPFRYSDNINRQLLFLYVVLLPGRIALEALVDLAQRVLKRQG